MRSDDAAESGTALISSMMEPIALTSLLRMPWVPSAPQSGCGYLNPNAQGLARRIRPAPLLVLTSWSASGMTRKFVAMQ
jgi:hypothetical protein